MALGVFYNLSPSTDSKDQQIHTKMAAFVFHRRKESDEGEKMVNVF